MKNKMNKVTNWIKAKATEIKSKTIRAALLAYATFAPVNVVGAAEDKWNAVIDFLLPWIQRLGGVVILIGAIEFGLAFKSDDAEGKTKGLRTVIAGCIVFAVGLSANIFLAP